MTPDLNAGRQLSRQDSACAACDRLTTSCLSSTCPLLEEEEERLVQLQHRPGCSSTTSSPTSSSSSCTGGLHPLTSSTPPPSSPTSSRANIHITSSSCWSRRDLKNYLLVLLCVYILIAPSLATPLFSPTMHRQHRTAKPKWVNPCGINTNALRRLSHAFVGSHYEVRPLSNAELLENVILAAKNALRHSKVFKEDYVKKTFRTPSWWDHHETWKDMRYDWLPTWREIPKHLHEKTTREHLRGLDVETSLRNVYSYLQRLAVGLEQVVLDQTLYDGDYMEEFNEAEFKLKAVLCELQVALLEKGILHDEPTSRRIMAKEVRDIEDDSYRNLRDWYIYRDYMNGLEYVIHTFDHLRKRA